jgi:hypothetical protein
VTELARSRFSEGPNPEPFMRQSVVRSVIAFALLAVVACSDATGPGRFAGSYRLERYEGTSLPATIYQSATMSVTILQQSLMLGEEGTGVATMTSRVVDAITPQGSETTTTSLLRFKVRSGVIEITFVCPPDADCIAQPVLGARIDGGLAISSPASSKPASIYRRVR